MNKGCFQGVSSTPFPLMCVMTLLAAVLFQVGLAEQPVSVVAAVAGGHSGVPFLPPGVPSEARPARPRLRPLLLLLCPAPFVQENAALTERLDKLEAAGPERMEMDTSGGEAGSDVVGRLADLEGKTVAHGEALAALEAALLDGGLEQRVMAVETELQLGFSDDPCALRAKVRRAIPAQWRPDLSLPSLLAC